MVSNNNVRQEEQEPEQQEKQHAEMKLKDWKERIPLNNNEQFLLKSKSVSVQVSTHLKGWLF